MSWTRGGGDPEPAARWAQHLAEVESRLARPAGAPEVEEAVESLEQACREWPALMACVTDRAVWESLAQQIARLERLAVEGGEALRTMEVLNSSARGYSGTGAPAKTGAGPAKIDCRG